MQTSHSEEFTTMYENIHIPGVEVSHLIHENADFLSRAVHAC